MYPYVFDLGIKSTRAQDKSSHEFMEIPNHNASGVLFLSRLRNNACALMLYFGAIVHPHRSFFNLQGSSYGVVLAEYSIGLKRFSHLSRCFQIQ
jgi:hypothetical protein